MKKGKVYGVFLLTVCSVVLVRAQKVDPIVTSKTGNPKNKDQGVQFGLSVRSLDNVYGTNKLPPTWIDPFASGTYSKSLTPRLNWDSLMWSNSISNMAHNSGLVPSFQLGEGIPVDSVKVVDDRTNSGISSIHKEAKEAHKKVVKMHDLAELKDLPPSPFGDEIPLHVDQSGFPLSSSTKENLLPNQNAGKPSTNGILEHKPDLIATLSQGSIDITGLSPDDPAHADIIDFMITKDMANGMQDVFASSQGQTIIDTDPTALDIFPNVPANDVIPTEDTPSTAFSKNDSTVDTQHGKKIKKTNKRQEKRKEKKLERQLKKQNRQVEKLQKQNQQKPGKQGKVSDKQIQQKTGKQVTVRRKQKVFSQKLAARKKKLQEQRLQKKLERHLTKIDNISQKLQQIEQTGTNNNTDVTPKAEAFSVVANEKEQINEHTVAIKSDKKGQNKNKNKKTKKNQKRVNIRERNPKKKTNKGKHNRKQKGRKA